MSFYQTGGIKTNEVPGFKYFNVRVEMPADSISLGYKNRKIRIEVLDEKKYIYSYELGGERQSFESEFGKLNTVPFDFRVQKSSLFTADQTKMVRDLQYEFIVHSKDNLVRKYKNSMSLQNEDYTSILTINVRDNLRGRATTFLDTLSKVYTEYTLEAQVSVNDNTRRYIEIQLGELELILDSLENEITNFKEKEKILDLSKEQNELFNSITELEKEKRETSLRIKSLENLNTFTTGDVNNTDLPPMLLSNEDKILQEQVNQLFDLKVQRVKLLSSSTEKNAEVIQLDTLIKIVTNNVQEYVQNTINSLKSSQNELLTEIKKIELELQDIPVSQQEILGIERKFTVHEGLYQYLLEKKASSVIARAAIIPQVSIIESARSIGVVGPNRGRTKTIAIGAGFILALIIGLLRLMFFDRIEHLQEFKQLTKLPVVGSVPSYANIKDKPLAIEDDLRSNVSESLRALRANLQYILITDNKTKRILTSSLHPGEGKTFISTNLSSFIAHTDKKVVILDFDMHKPKVHKVFNMVNKVGLSSYLIGKKPLDEIIQSSSVQNLDVITAGPIPPNASDLILNEKVEQLLLELEEIYDYIFIDTPPLMLISDSLVLMKHVNIGLFVFNTDKASKQGLNYLESLLEQNNITKVSLILNNVKHKRWLYYYGKYSYKYSYKYGSYGYSYTYGGSDKKKK